MVKCPTCNNELGEYDKCPKCDSEKINVQFQASEDPKDGDDVLTASS